MVTKKDREKYGITATTKGYPDGEYWKKRCEAAEMVIPLFGTYVYNEEARKIYDDWQQLKSQEPR